MDTVQTAVVATLKCQTTGSEAVSARLIHSSLCSWAHSGTVNAHMCLKFDLLRMICNFWDGKPAWNAHMHGWKIQ